MRIMTNNVIENNSSIAMTNSDPNYSVESIYSNMLEEIVQVSGNSTVITVSFSSDQIVDSIFFGYHNLNTAQFVFKNSGGSTLDTVIFSIPELYAKEYIDELTTVRSIIITLTAEISSDAFIGNIACGKYAEIYNVVMPIEVENIDTSEFTETDGGQSLYRTGVELQSFDVLSRKLTNTQIAEFRVAYSYVKKGKGFWMDRTEDTNDQRYSIFNSNYRSNRNNTLTDLRFSVKEAR